jgi:hypothetical protein
MYISLKGSPLGGESEEVGEMTGEQMVRHWLYSSDVDFQAMETLFQKGHHVWALLVGHRVIEKLLRAYYVKEQGGSLPQTRHLLEVAQRANLDPSDDQVNLLMEMASFPLDGDDWADEAAFYKKATRKFTETYVNRIVELRQWLIKKIKE